MLDTTALLPMCKLRRDHLLRSAVTSKVSTDITPTYGLSNRVDSVVTSQGLNIWHSGRMTGTRGTVDVANCACYRLASYMANVALDCARLRGRQVTI